jgi:hypothetical protein
MLAPSRVFGPNELNEAEQAPIAETVGVDAANVWRELLRSSAASPLMRFGI